MNTVTGVDGVDMSTPGVRKLGLYRKSSMKFMQVTHKMLIRACEDSGREGWTLSTRPPLARARLAPDQLDGRRTRR